MAFIRENNSVISFAEYSDVTARDQRVFDSNEGLTDDVVEEALIRATQRILAAIRSSGWWRDYYISRDNTITYNTRADIPEVDADQIQSRQNDFTDLCVFWALSDYILPQVANFGDETDDDRAKMGYYKGKADALLQELIQAGDWYDFNDDSVIQSSEKEPGVYALRRIR